MCSDEKYEVIKSTQTEAICIAITSSAVLQFGLCIAYPKKKSWWELHDMSCQNKRHLVIYILGAFIFLFLIPIEYNVNLGTCTGLKILIWHRNQMKAFWYPTRFEPKLAFVRLRYQIKFFSLHCEVLLFIFVLLLCFPRIWHDSIFSPFLLQY